MSWLRRTGPGWSVRTAGRSECSGLPGGEPSCGRKHQRPRRHRPGTGPRRPLRTWPARSSAPHVTTCFLPRPFPGRAGRRVVCNGLAAVPSPGLPAEPSSETESDLRTALLHSCQLQTSELNSICRERFGVLCEFISSNSIAISLLLGRRESVLSEGSHQVTGDAAVLSVWSREAAGFDVFKQHHDASEYFRALVPWQQGLRVHRALPAVSSGVGGCLPCR